MKDEIKKEIKSEVVENVGSAGAEAPPSPPPPPTPTPTFENLYDKWRKKNETKEEKNLHHQKTLSAGLFNQASLTIQTS